MNCELYETVIDGVPVSCQIVETCYYTGKSLVQYTTKDGVLQKWVSFDRLTRTPRYDISQ